MNDRTIGSIILESASTTEDVVVTDTKGSNRVLAEGILQTLGDENRNHRIYLKEDIEPEVYGPRIKELIKANQFFSECGHPMADDLVRQQTIAPNNIIARFLKVWIEGDLIKGQFKGTNNDLGEWFDKDLREGAKPAWSLRSLGSIENIGGKAYVKNIKIITWDYVVFPSHKRAYTERIVSESASIKGESENQIVVPNDDPGRVITLKESDARTVINRLQRESANFSTIVETFDGLYDKITLVNEHTVMMTSKFGEKICINLEDHVDNLIMDFAYRN